MKFTLATALLLAGTSAKQLFNLEDELTEDMRFFMSEHAEERLDRFYDRRIERTQRDMEHALRDWYRRNNKSGHPPRYPGAEKDEFNRQYANTVTKDLFGWAIEDKIKSLKPMERYGPLAMDIMKSDEVKNYGKFFMEQAEKPDPQLVKVAKEAQWLEKDIFGGCGRYGCTDGIEGDEYRVRPSERERENMSGYERDKREGEVTIVDNTQIRDIAEDMEDLWNDFEDLMDPKSNFMTKMIEVDGKFRFSPKVQELVDKIMGDFGVNSKEEFEQAMERIEERVETDMENCPYFRRMRKSVERYFRYLMKNVRISELPFNTKPADSRARWVDHLTRQLYQITKSSHSIERLEDMLGRIIEEVTEDYEEWVEEVDRAEQKYNKKGYKW